MALEGWASGEEVLAQKLSEGVDQINDNTDQIDFLAQRITEDPIPDFRPFLALTSGSNSSGYGWKEAGTSGAAWLARVNGMTHLTQNQKLRAADGSTSWPDDTRAMVLPVTTDNGALSLVFTPWLDDSSSRDEIGSTSTTTTSKTDIWLMTSQGTNSGFELPFVCRMSFTSGENLMGYFRTIKVNAYGRIVEVTSETGVEIADTSAC